MTILLTPNLWGTILPTIRVGSIVLAAWTLALTLVTEAHEKVVILGPSFRYPTETTRLPSLPINRWMLVIFIGTCHLAALTETTHDPP